MVKDNTFTPATEARMSSISPLLFNFILEVLSKKKRARDWKRRHKISLFMENTTVSIESSKVSTKKQLELVSLARLLATRSIYKNYKILLRKIQV